MLLGVGLLLTVKLVGFNSVLVISSSKTIDVFDKKMGLINVVLLYHL